MDEITKTIKDIVSKQLNIPSDKINLDSKFIDDLNGDSLDTVEMILELEDCLNIEIPDDVAEELFDINSVLNYLNSINYKK